MKKRLEKGFTLIELMIVVAIIAILAAVAIPKFGEQVKKSRDGKGLATLSALRSAVAIETADIGQAVTVSGIKALLASNTKNQLKADATAFQIAVGTNDDGNGGNKITGTIDDYTGAVINLTVPDDEGIIVITSGTGSNRKDTKGTDWKDK